MDLSQGYISFATRSENYLRYAINLRLSCFYNDPKRPFCLITDRDLFNRLEELKISHYFDEIVIYEGDRHAWEIKLDLFKLSPFEESIYIEADSLVVKDPEPAWDLVEGKKFTVQGPQHFHGEWYGKTQYEIMKKMKIDYFPKFNGGFLYFDKSDEAGGVFATADYLLSHKYDELGFRYHHGMRTDEPIIGIAMALANLKPLPDSSNIMFTILGIDYWFGKVAKLSLSLPERKVRFNKNGTSVSPIILHCCGGLRDSWRYRHAERKLKKMVYIERATA